MRRDAMPLARHAAALTPQMSAATKKLFGKAQFDAMKQGSVFVNTARYVLCVPRLPALANPMILGFKPYLGP